MNADFQNQLISSNCITPYGCSTYYPQPVVYNPRQLTIEAVTGGYIISGHVGKEPWRTVAISADGLAEILKGWGAQFPTTAG